MKPKIILAYSGGLDTSVMLKWLVNKGYDVVAFIADVGQAEDLFAIKLKALATGAMKVHIVDLKEKFVTSYIFEALKAGAIYEGSYLLGTALARPLIAKTQVEIALSEGTNILAHGCTGKGNDQARFEFTWMRFMPEVKIISPWKEEDWLEQFRGRNELMEYATKHGIEVEATSENPYSSDANLMHISYESGKLEDPMSPPDESMYKLSRSPAQAPDKETKVRIKFHKGIPVEVIDMESGHIISGALDIFNYLNKIGAQNGIGRIDIVENRFVGIKSRGIYETPAGTILHKAHQDIESITLDCEVTHLKSILAPIIATKIYNGFWHSPEMDFLMAAVDQSQKNVSGNVYLTLYKGNVIVTGRESDNSLYDQALSSMNEDGGYNQKDARGFLGICGLRLKLGRHVAIETLQKRGFGNETMG